MVATIGPKELNEPFLEQAIHEPNFFNGRILTAGDLVTLQKAVHLRDQRLGQAVGAGVVYGLEVRLVSDASDGQPPVLAVSEGLAFNRQGMAISLHQNIEVKLEQVQPESVTPSGFFDVCLPPKANGKPLPGKGVYLFVSRPAAGYRGLAPRRGFGQAAKVEGCDRDLLVEGVQFRFLSIDIDQLDNLAEDTRIALKDLLQKTEVTGQTGLAAQNKLRNWLAHVCFDIETLQDGPFNPFAYELDEFFHVAASSSLHNDTVVDHLRSQGLVDDCDVPLALVCWTTTGVKWVDMWSVRRRLVSQRREAHRLAEAEATFLQFQDQVKRLTQPERTQTELAQIRAIDYFRYLPSGGLLPLGGIRGSRGFNSLKFFETRIARSPVYQTLVVGGKPVDPLIIEGAHVEGLLRRSLTYPPIDLTSTNPNGNILIWVYAVRENKQGMDSLAVPMPQPYLIFTTGQMSNQAEAHYDVSRWDYGNYA